MNEIELTQELVRINSENPPGNEKQVAKFIYDYLQDLKIQSELIEFENNRFDVVAEMGRGEGLMFNGHIDTVPAGDLSKWTQDPFGGKLTGNKIYGRGSSDMKGGVACVLAAVDKLHKQRFKKRLLLIFVADEESGSKGSKHIIENRGDLLKGIKYGVFAESTGFELSYAQKGIVHVKVKFTGKAAHGSSPELGVNAIEKAVKFVSGLEKLKADIAETRDSELSSGTINVGRIVSGTKVNIVPDYCEVEVDRRIVPGETPKTALEQLRRVLKQVNVDGKIEPMKEPRFPMKLAKNSEIIRLIQRISKVELKATTGYLESELFKTECGIDCVGIGPGLHEQAHVADEFVTVSNLRKALHLYENLIRKWCL